MSERAVQTNTFYTASTVSVSGAEVVSGL
ncbi:MAG: hypothetical protein RIQ69_1363, partial [Pseudomonadota bacterium]